MVTPRTASKGPASAGPFRVLVLLLAAVLVVGGAGCKAKGGGGADSGEGGLDESKAAKPQALDPSLGGTSTTAAGGTATTATTGRGATGTTRPGGGPTGPGGSTATTAAPVPFRPLVEVADRTGDHGLSGKPFGDMVSVRAEDNGTSARFTVSVAGDIPAVLPTEETLGIGVNIDRKLDDRDSDFQVYALGTEEGWLAYYFDGSTQRQFPGTFELGANKVVFVVSWAALGGRSPSQMSVFCDWSGSGTLLTPSSEDHTPDRGTTPLAP